MWQVWDPQIVWKILSDENWVMMPNKCENLSNEWWVMNDELWKLSDKKTEAKQPLSLHENLYLNVLQIKNIIIQFYVPKSSIIKNY